MALSETNDFRQVRHRIEGGLGHVYTLQRKYVEMICISEKEKLVLVHRDVWKDVPIVNAEDIK